MTEILEVLLSCDLKRLKSLVENGLDVNFQIPGTEGCTPLHIIVGIEKLDKKEEIMSYLLELGADPNARSVDDLTPVHIASMWNNCFELEKLLQNGGNPWLTDNQNKNSFDMAADNHAYQAFQVLNIYLAEDKFTFKDSNYAKKHSKTRIKHEPVECKDNEFANDSLSETSGISFLTANDNFLSQISSADESETFIINLSKFLKRRSFCKEKNKSQISEKFEHENAPSLSSLYVPINNITKPLVPKKELDCQKQDLNKSFYFSSNENDHFDTTTHHSHSQDSTFSNLILDGDDESDVVLVTENASENCSIDSSQNSSVLSTCSDWKTFQAKSISTRSSCRGSDCSYHPSTSILMTSHLRKYSNSKIFEELQNLGDKPGPVLDHTREVYLRRLAKLKSGCKVSCLLPEPKYCPEIYLFLEGKLNMARIQNMEHLMSTEFSEINPEQKWREGSQRSCFNYFLLDPRVTQNLPARASQLTLEKTFMTFIDSLFYVGKGSRGRPYSHLLEAVKTMQSNAERSDKIAHILDIWSSGLGVVSLHCFHNSVPVESYTKEACIIEAMGISNLTNVKTGDYYGISTKWTKSRKRQIGISLLNRALQIFILEGERQIKPKDIKSVK